MAVKHEYHFLRLAPRPSDARLFHLQEKQGRQRLINKGCELEASYGQGDPK